MQKRLFEVRRSQVCDQYTLLHEHAAAALATVFDAQPQSQFVEIACNRVERIVAVVVFAIDTIREYWRRDIRFFITY